MFQQLGNNVSVTWSATLARGLPGPGSPLAGRMFTAERWAVLGAEPRPATGVIYSVRPRIGQGVVDIHQNYWSPPVWPY